MEILIFLVPLASVVVAAAIWAFIWALRRGQFDDLDSPAWRVVFDDQEQQRKSNEDKPES
jgi:cbb3-type cytochrome oxidase maturation protein